MFNLSKEEKEKNSKIKVIVGMSGGVDSSVAALILKEQGYNVSGMYMRNWEDNDDDSICSAYKDYEDVIEVCEKIGIENKVVEFVDEYWNNVFKDFLEEYKMGLTPNPDILCNSEIKFKVFLEKAIELGADYLATGHYTRVKDGNLLKGKDPGKDQSYFLHAIDKNALQKVMFPIGDILKSEVRNIANKYDLKTKAKKDSTGICFIGERNFRNFLSKYIGIKEGNLINLDNGKVVGRHQGMAYYTIGQRKGLGIGAMKDSIGEPWFVVDKNVEKNEVYVVQGLKHPALFSDDLITENVNWLIEKDRIPRKITAKVRYRQFDQECELEALQDGKYKVHFKVPQRAVARGQSVVFYDGDICLGGGVIIQNGKSYFEMKKNLPEIVSA